MRAGVWIVLAAIGALAGIISSPPQVREQIAETTHLPDHVYVEAERQIEMFVSWARTDFGQPEVEREAEPVETEDQL